MYTVYPGFMPEGSLLIAALLGTPVVLVVVLVVVVVQGFRNRQIRRVVAIMWDVVTFWPRSTHPLTPPSYGGRTVLDLRIRLAELTTSSPDGSPSTRVVLVAHSQGTIIAAATLMQCKESHEIYPLLTFGSPLRRLYARNFPAYFGYPAMTGLARTLSWPGRRWINLWAHTDPIGGWVFDPAFVCYCDKDDSTVMTDALNGVDCRILDLPQVNPKAGRVRTSRCTRSAATGDSGTATSTPPRSTRCRISSFPAIEDVTSAGTTRSFPWTKPASWPRVRSSGRSRCSRRPATS